MSDGGLSTIVPIGTSVIGPQTTRSSASPESTVYAIRNCDQQQRSGETTIIYPDHYQSSDHGGSNMNNGMYTSGIGNPPCQQTTTTTTAMSSKQYNPCMANNGPSSNYNMVGPSSSTTYQQMRNSTMGSGGSTLYASPTGQGVETVIQYPMQQYTTRVQQQTTVQGGGAPYVRKVGSFTSAPQYCSTYNPNPASYITPRTVVTSQTKDGGDGSSSTTTIYQQQQYPKGSSNQNTMIPTQQHYEMVQQQQQQQQSTLSPSSVAIVGTGANNVSSTSGMMTNAGTRYLLTESQQQQQMEQQQQMHQQQIHQQIHQQQIQQQQQVQQQQAQQQAQQFQQYMGGLERQSIMSNGMMQTGPTIQYGTIQDSNKRIITTAQQYAEQQHLRITSGHYSENVEAAIAAGKIYVPEKATFVPGDVIKRAGMETLYDSSVVPTFESEVEITVVPRKVVVDMKEPEPPASVADTVSTQSKEITEMPVEKPVVQRRTHCC